MSYSYANPITVSQNGACSTLRNGVCPNPAYIVVCTGATTSRHQQISNYIRKYQRIDAKNFKTFNQHITGRGN